MTAHRKIQPVDIVAAVLIAAAGALIFGVVLASMSAPGDFKDRLAVVDQRIERAKTLLQPARDRGAYGADALCAGDPAQQAKRLQDEVSTQAAQNNLSLDSLETRVEIGDALAERLTPVRVRFSATGSYEGAVALLALLARERPQVFVDSLDMTPKTANVTLALSGRVFCAA